MTAIQPTVSYEETPVSPDELNEHFKTCLCHDSWDQCPCADGGHPADHSCGCCPLGTGLCGPRHEPTAAERAAASRSEDAP